MPARRSIPPDRVRILAFLLPPSMTLSIATPTATRIRAGGTSFSSAKYSTYSATVKPG